MRICFLTREYPPDTPWGGPAFYYHTLAHGLAKLGHEVHVICQAVGQQENHQDNGVFVHKVGTDPTGNSVRGRLNYNLCEWLKVRRVVNEYDIEIVEAVDWSADGFLYSLRKEVPLVIAALGATDNPVKTGTYFGAAHLIAWKLLPCLAAFAINKADMILAISRQCYEAVISKYRVHPAKVEIVHPGIDTERYRFVKSNIKNRLGIPDDAPLILYVGRLEGRNGVHVLCKAIPLLLKHYSDARFVFVGRDTKSVMTGGSFKQYIKNRAQLDGFERNTIFIDFLSDDELMRLFSASDIYVYPALASTFGLSILQAMACGKPVVSTRVGVAPELGSISPTGIRVVSIGSPSELAEAILGLASMKNADKERVFIENRRLVVSRFSIPIWIGRLLKAYEKVKIQDSYSSSESTSRYASS